MKMTTALIEIKEFLAGETIDGAFAEAIRLSTLLGVRCEFNFNGVICISKPHGDVNKGVSEYFEEINKEEGGTRIAFA